VSRVRYSPSSTTLPVSHFNAYALRLAQLHLWFSGSFAKSACLYAARGLSQVTSSSSLRLWSLQCLQRHLLEQVAWRIVGQGKPSGTRDAPVLNWELNVEPKEFEDMVRQNCCIRTVPDTHPLDRLKTGRHVTKSPHRYRPIYMYVSPITSAPPKPFYRESVSLRLSLCPIRCRLCLLPIEHLEAQQLVCLRVLGSC
jgi:hypothetical protein